LHAAHEARSEQGHPLGIVHRDVSPQNILVGVDGVPRVLDFGVAKAAGRAQTTREGQLKGKIAYMSPEQLMGREVTRSTDIFAASVVLWEALTGRRLFAGESEGEVVKNVLDAHVERPSKLASGLSPSIDALVLRGLARDPAERFASAREMARALERVMPLAPASEVGEFVEKMAAPMLAFRAERIAKIESGSPMLGEIPPSAGSPSASTWPVLVIQEHASSGRGARIAAPAPPREHSSATNAIGAIVSDSVAGRASGTDGKPALQGRGRRVLVLGVAAAGAVCGVLLLAGASVAVRDRREPRNERAVTIPAPLSSAQQTSAASPGLSAPAADERDTSPVPVEALPTAAPLSSAAPPPTSPAAGHGGSPAARPFPHAHAPVSCDPPFTVDANGFRHYKRDCVR
jgi:serine/threonine-protein kinase